MATPTATVPAPGVAPSHAEAQSVPPPDHAPRVLSRDPGDFARPTGREEEWRFSPLKKLSELLVGDESSAALTTEITSPDGVSVEYLATDDAVLTSLPLPVDRIAALAMALAPATTRIVVPSGVTLAEPIVIGLHGDESTQVNWGHLILDVGANAKASVVVEHSGVAQYGESFSVVVGDGAQLELVHVQRWDSAAVHSAHVAFSVGRDARVRSLQASVGGGVVRVVETVDYRGPGADVELLGLFFAESGEHVEHRLWVDHSTPHCRSNVVYKGALQGDSARSVWVGDVIIRAAAIGTQTYEINRNLLLTEGARADSVPNLEIETGNVSGAGHASATGRFDDEQLFYLQSRGIDSDTARRLVVRGFFAEVLARISVDEVRDRVLSTIETKLSATEAPTSFEGEPS